MTMTKRARVRGQHLPALQTQGVRPQAPGVRESGTMLLAAAVVQQALWDAPRPSYRDDVRASIGSGALGWWLLVAGVDERTVPRALAAIMARVHA